MFRNHYDNDVTIWSPQGRIHQIEYAMEAVNQGSVALALKNNAYAVITSLKRSADTLTKHQRKTIVIDDHVGVAVSGLQADAQMLAKFMREECLNSKWAYDNPIAVERLARAIATKSQRNTQIYGRRPYGVGMLLVGVSNEKPQIFQTCPSGNYFECIAMAIGARSQSARTYLEKHLDSFNSCSLEDLIKHSIQALTNTLTNEDALTEHKTDIGIVGVDQSFRMLTEEELKNWLSKVETKKPSRATEEQMDTTTKD